MIDRDFEAANAAILGIHPTRAIERERDALRRAMSNDECEREDANAREAVRYLTASYWRG